MDTIILQDLEVFYRVGVPDEERARPQRLLLTIELERNFTAAAASDDLRETIDYAALAAKLIRFGEGREWKLIETLAADIATWVLSEFQPGKVTLQIKKFVIPQALWVGVRISRPAP